MIFEDYFPQETPKIVERFPSFGQEDYNKPRVTSRNEQDAISRMLTYQLIKSKWADEINNDLINEIVEDNRLEPKPDQVEFPHTGVHKKIRGPFLEEAASYLYCKEPIALDLVNYPGIQDVKEYLREEFKELGKIAKEASRVYSEQPIDKVLIVETKKFLRYWYPCFEVKRKDNTLSRFSEADYSNMNPEDILFLYKDLAKKTNEGLHFQTGYQSVRRFMRAQMFIKQVTDFQLGLESNVKLLNITAPKQDHPHLHEHKYGDLIRLPYEIGPGIVYKNSENEEKFFQFDEAHKYSEGTNLLILGLLQQRLDLFQEKKIKLKRNDLVDIEYGRKKITRVFSLRKYLRKYEVLLGTRVERKLVFEDEKEQRVTLKEAKELIEHRSQAIIKKYFIENEKAKLAGTL